MTGYSFQSKQRPPADAVPAARGSRVIVCFAKVPVMPKESHRRLEEAARDAALTARRMFPVA